MNPILFEIFGFELRWYTVLVTIAIATACFMTAREAKKFGYSNDFLFDLAFYVVVFGIIGARLYYVIFNYKDYSSNLLRIFYMWEGGLAIHGGVIGGFIALVFYCTKHKTSILRTTDCIAPALLLAQASGRWGNFFNSEAHGPVTTLENLQRIKILPAFVIKGMNIGGVYYHPTFFYESLWCLIGVVLILLVRRYLKYIKVGQLTCIYFMWYGIGRYFVEGLRTDSLMLGTYKVAQVVSITCIIMGLAIFIYLCVKKDNKNYYRSE